MKKLAFAILGCAALFVTNLSAQADLISAINNPGFELPAAASGFSTAGLQTTADIPSWDDGWGGTYTTKDSVMIYRDSKNTAGSTGYPSPQEGLDQVCFVLRQSGTSYTTSAFAYQLLGTVDAADVGALLTASVDCATRDQSYNDKYATALIGFYTGTGVRDEIGVLRSTGGSRLLEDNSTGFSDYGTITDTFTIGSDLIGQNLYLVVSLSAPTAGITGSSCQYLADNAQYSYTAVPEPGTLSLLACGLIGLLCYAWRKRK